MNTHKLFIFIFVMFIFCNVVCAEIIEVNKNLDIEFKNNTFHVTGEDIDYEKEISVSTTITGSTCTAELSDWDKSINMHWYQNVTSNTDANLLSMNTALNNMTEYISSMRADIGSYYGKYVECVSAKDALSTYKSETEPVKKERDDYKALLDSKTVESVKLADDKSKLETTLQTCKSDFEQKSSNTGFLWVLIIILAVVVAILGFKLRPMTKVDKSPLHDNTSQDFKNLE
jgi:hypothetical protein